MQIWFWQLIISPHMAGLARALAEEGIKVVYIAQREMTGDRALQGWLKPPLGNAKLQLVPTSKLACTLANSAPIDAIHICQGVRGSGQIAEVQKTLAALGRKQWVVMETVEDSGWRGVAKRLVYQYLFRRMNRNLEGVLAIGYRTKDWLVAIGVPSHKVFPFAYFLPDDGEKLGASHTPVSHRFRVLFVGQFIQRKRLDLLIAAMTELNNPNTELAVIGSGPLEETLRHHAEKLLPGRVLWIGRLPIHEVQKEMMRADCLVLPSRHDGWGAVVSEALMMGTPVICSDDCGSAGVAQASGVGGVFRSGSRADLVHLIEQVVAAGKPSHEERSRLAHWASSLGAKRGAEYLLAVLESKAIKAEPPMPPWCR